MSDCGFLNHVGQDLVPLLVLGHLSGVSVQLGFQVFGFLDQRRHIRFRRQVVGAESFQDFSVLALVKGGGNAALHIVLPPFQGRLHILLLEVRIPLGHLEGTGDGVLTAAHELLRIVVILGFEEGSNHDNLVHAEKVSVQRRLQSVILRNIILPVLDTLGGLHFEDGGGLTIFAIEQVVPHTAENGAFPKEVTVGLTEVVFAPNVGRCDQIAHEVGLLHVLGLLRLDGLTSDGVDRVLERLLIGAGHFAPNLERCRPRVQTEDSGEASTGQLLRTLGRDNLDFVTVKPFHFCLPPYNSQIHQRHIPERQHQDCYRRAYSNPLPSLR